ncbi:MAG: NAD-dependent protein deacylase, partial [Rickettsiales bacterium]|nr:NAD-dependent protein deacylase [Rickettsiales bacterium]
AHEALARLAKEWPAPVRLVTQNVDDLHGRAGVHYFPKGDYPLIHMHGELKKARHLDTGDIREQEDDLGANDDWRPHIVWFGEMPLDMDRIYTALRQTSLFLSIGTSGNVYPAAGFFAEAKRCGAYTMEINLEPSANADYFDDGIYGPATKTVPDFVNRLLAGEVVID